MIKITKKDNDRYYIPHTFNIGDCVSIMSLSAAAKEYSYIEDFYEAFQITKELHSKFYEEYKNKKGIIRRGLCPIWKDRHHKPFPTLIMVDYKKDDGFINVLSFPPQLFELRRLK